MTISVGDRRQLLWDNIGTYLISAQGGGVFTRVVNTPEKMGPAFANDAWELPPYMIGPYGSVQYDPVVKRFKMWYTVQQPGAPWRFLAYAFSTNATTWTKPNLGLVTFNGTTSNNIVDMHQLADDPAAPSSRDNLVFIDTAPGIPGSERYKHLSFLFGVGIRVQTSSDGIHWSVPSVVPFPYNVDNFISGGYNADASAYVFWLRGYYNGVPGVQPRVAIRHVVPTGTLLSAWPAPTDPFQHYGGGIQELGHNGITSLGVAHALHDVYQAGHNHYSEAENMHIFLPTILSSATDKENLHLAFSRSNGLGFQWLDGNGYTTPFIGRDVVGGESGSLYFMNRVRRGDWDYFFYSASDATHSVLWNTSGSVSVAKLKRERITGWQYPAVSELFINEAGSGDPLTFTGKHLYINCTIPANGWLKAYFELPGGGTPGRFGLPDSIQVNGPVDNLDLQIKFLSGDDLTSINGIPLVLVIRASFATVYAFQFGEIFPPGEENTSIPICDRAGLFSRVMSTGQEVTYDVTGYTMTLPPQTLDNLGIVTITDWTNDSFTLLAGSSPGFERVTLTFDGESPCDMLFWVMPTQEMVGC